MHTAEGKIRCPSCGGVDVRRSLPRGLVDRFFLLFGKRPVRCRACEYRFYRSLPNLPEAALDVNPDQPPARQTSAP
jgi:DNA-directed RNA polymerase subunit RPC12/RpoP